MGKTLFKKYIYEVYHAAHKVTIFSPTQLTISVKYDIATRTFHIGNREKYYWTLLSIFFLLRGGSPYGV